MPPAGDDRNASAIEQISPPVTQPLEATRFETIARYLLILSAPMVIALIIVLREKLGSQPTIATLIGVGVLFALLALNVVASTLGRRQVIAERCLICPRCLYRLRGLDSEGVCPECGRAYTRPELTLTWRSAYGLPPHE